MTPPDMTPLDMTPLGSILDVPGIRVGHHQRRGRGWQTGTTVVLATDGATPGVDVRGGGPGTRETDALRPDNLVQRIHAVTLTGGSAYGLAAADGVMSEMSNAGLGFAIGGGVVPIVPAAVIFDLGRGGSFDNRPDAAFGERAARRALVGRTIPSWGAVGAGTGARAGGLQGGVGTASRTLVLGGTTVTVGALAVVNANGSVIDSTTGLPWQPDTLPMPRLTARSRRAVRDALSAAPRATLNTTIGVVALDADLTKAECSKVAAVAHDGLARAIRPAHAMTDGDTVFTLATGGVRLEPSGEPLGGRIARLNAILVAAADVFAAACTHAVVSAASAGDAPAWRDLVEQ